MWGGAPWSFAAGALLSFGGFVIRIGRGVPGRRLVPAWADVAGKVQHWLLLGALLGVVLW